MIYDEESDRTLLDVITGVEAIDPQELLINREKFGDLQVKLSELLSDLERKVLDLYVEGRTYQEISIELKRHEKSIDNAIQRVKRKLEEVLKTEGINT